MRVIAVDTETPGFKKPLRPVEVGILYFTSALVSSKPDGDFVERYALEGQMEWGALSVTHILPVELEGRPKWDAKTWNVNHMPGVDYVVGHNVDFDAEVLGIDSTKVKLIDTLALSRYWLPDLDSHKLGALMYHQFGANEVTRERLRGAHGAGTDVRNTVDWLQAAVSRYAVGVHNWLELYALSELGRVPYRMTFGKYGPKDGNKGKRIRDLLVEDRGYVSWLRKNCADDKYLIKALDNPR